MDDRAAIDVVYTWVDGAWPGYPELLRRHARDRHDLNPNRYRDNLDLLKYSLRSLVRHADFVRNVYLVTMRPQIPDWLDPGAPRLRVVHHDQLMEPTELPTFNSFGIVTHLHELAGLSERFLYVEDDMLFGARTGLSDFVAADGRVKLYPKLMATPSGATHHRPRWSPWNNALAQSNALLDLHYAKTRRPFIAHAPLLIDKASFARFIAAFPEAVQTTRRSRFRGPGNIAPEHMYPYYLWHEGLATLLPRRQRFRNLGYAGLSSNLPLTAGQLALLRWSRPKFCCLNDNFEAHPNPRAVRLTREFLERSHPTRSEFERHVSGT